MKCLRHAGHARVIVGANFDGLLFLDKAGELLMSLGAMSPGHVAVITGGASGIGLAAAMRFAKAGMKVCIADIGRDRLEEAAAKLSSAAGDAAKIMTAVVDVTRIEQLQKLERAVQERFGGTDILMNNAGIQPGSQMFGP